MEAHLEEFVGRLHPLLVHFPIALILTGGAIELLRPRRAERPSSAGLTCLALGAVSALLAVGSGWLHARHVDVGSDLEVVLFRHRWVGVGIAVVAGLTALLAAVERRASRPTLGVAKRAGVIVAMALTVYGGHLGGTLVYGEGYLLDTLRPPREPAPAPPAVDRPDVTEAPPPAVDPPQAADDPSAAEEPVPVEPVPVEPVPVEPVPVEPVPPAADADTEPPPAVAAISYEADVLPIFEARCFKCHGPTGRAKGALRLHRAAALFRGTEDEWLVVPGAPEKSRLYELITLPADDLDIMPATGDPLTADQIATVERWILAGAPYAGQAAGGAGAPPPEPTPSNGDGDAGQGDSARSPSPASPVRAPVELDDEARRVRDDAIAALRSRGVHASRIAQDSDAVEVNLGLLRERFTNEHLDLLAGLEPCLVSLDLSRTAIDDAGARPHADIPRRPRQRLDGTRVGDAGVRALAGLAELEYLNLFRTKVTDAGLAVLAELPRLKSLYVWQTGVTDEGLAALRAARPGMRVVDG